MSLKAQITEYLNKEWYYTALKSSAELHYKNKFLDESISPTLLFTEAQLSAIYDQIESDHERLVRILSIGEKWDEDEVLLILTIYIQLKLIVKYFQDFEIDFNPISFSRIDELLEELESVANLKSLEISKNLIRKNWPAIQLNDFFK